LVAVGALVKVGQMYAVLVGAVVMVGAKVIVGAVVRVGAWVLVGRPVMVGVNDGGIITVAVGVIEGKAVGLKLSITMPPIMNGGISVRMELNWWWIDGPQAISAAAPTNTVITSTSPYSTMP
jgi:hypothetical protein